VIRLTYVAHNRKYSFFTVQMEIMTFVRAHLQDERWRPYFTSAKLLTTYRIVRCHNILHHRRYCNVYVTVETRNLRFCLQNKYSVSHQHISSVTLTKAFRTSPQIISLTSSINPLPINVKYF